MPKHKQKVAIKIVVNINKAEQTSRSPVRNKDNGHVTLYLCLGVLFQFYWAFFSVFVQRKVLKSIVYYRLSAL
jgi:hypothetical protein